MIWLRIILCPFSTLRCKCALKMEFSGNKLVRLGVMDLGFPVPGAGAESVWKESGMRPPLMLNASSEQHRQRKPSNEAWTEHSIGAEHLRQNLPSAI